MRVHVSTAYQYSVRYVSNIIHLPFTLSIAVHIHDIDKILSQGQDTVEVNGTLMINFEKWTRLWMYMEYVFRHKPLHLAVHREVQAGALAYLEQQLNPISFGGKIDDLLEERIRVLEKKEDVAHRNHLLELSAAGFPEVRGRA